MINSLQPPILSLAQACSLCPIQNSLYIPHTAPPAGASLQLVPNSEFKILPPSYSSHLSLLSHKSYLSHNSKFFSAEPSPLARACSSCPIQNSEFKIHNLPIPLALFIAHYRLKKLFSLW